MAVVVLPTPPFWLATAMTRPMILFVLVLRAGYANGFAKSMPDSGATGNECFTWNTPGARFPGEMRHLSPEARSVSRETDRWTLRTGWLPTCNIRRSVPRGALLGARIIMR